MQESNSVINQISFGLSIAAFIISIVVPLFEYKWNKLLNKTNLEAEYFKQLYNDFLVQEIPDARNYLHYSNNKFTGISQFMDVLREMRKKSIFFKYHNKIFYEKLLNSIQKIEDDLVLNEGDMDADTYVSFYTRLESEICVMYDCIIKGYLGKNFKLNWKFWKHKT